VGSKLALVSSSVQFCALGRCEAGRFESRFEPFLHSYPIKMVVLTTRCCLNRIDHSKSLGSHPDAQRRRAEAEKRRRRRNQQERSANVALRTTVDYDQLNRRGRSSGGSEKRTHGEMGLFEQASSSVISWAENLGLVDVQANVKANIRSRMDFDILVEEGISNNSSSKILGTSAAGGEMMKSDQSDTSSSTSTSNSNGGIVVAQFGAPWCKACEQMQKKMLEVYRTHTDVTFIRVDAKNNLQLCRDLGVKKLPWFQIYTPNTQKLAASPSASALSTQRYTKEDRPKLVVNVHATKQNQKLLSRQIDEIKQIMAR